MSAIARRRTEPQRALAWLGVLALAVGAWLARPADWRSAEAPLPPLCAVLVDTSASATALRPRWRQEVLAVLHREARAAAELGEEVLVVVYARGAERRFPAGDPAVLSAALAGASGVPFPLGPPAASPGGAAPVRSAATRGADPGAGPGAHLGLDLGTDLAAALALAADALAEPGRPPGRLVVLGEGAHLGPAAALTAALGRAAAAVRELRAEPLSPPTLANLALRSATAPERAPEGVPLGIHARLGWRPPRLGPEALSAALSVTPVGGPLAELQERTGTRAPLVQSALPLTAEGTRERQLGVDLRVPPLPRGVHTLEVRAALAGAADPLPHDDATTVVVTVGDLYRVALCAADRGAAAAVALGLGDGADAGLALRPVTAAELPAALPDCDVLWTLGVPLAALPAADVRAHLARGGGWLHAAGTELLRVDGGALLDELALVPAPDPRPPREVHFLVDGSGSMKGALWRRVALALAAVVPEVRLVDSVHVRFFTTWLGEELLRSVGAADAASAGHAAERLAAVLALVHDEPAGGATNIASVLHDLVAEQERDGAPVADRQRLVVLLSDGLSETSVEQGAAVREALGRHQFALRLVQIGDDLEGRRYLERLLLPGERLVEGGALEGLAEQLRGTLHDERLHLEAPVRAEASRAGEDLAAALARAARGSSSAAGAATGARPDAELGVAQRALRAALGPGAAAAWTVGEGAPLLAVAPRGRGLVATLATLPSADWCAPLAARMGLLVPTLAALGERARAEAAEGRLAPEPTADGLGLELQDGDPGWPAELTVRYVEPGGSDAFGRPRPDRERAVARAWPAPLPGAPRRRYAERPPAAAAAGLVRLEDPRSGAVLASFVLPAAPPLEASPAEQSVAWPPPGAAGNAGARGVGPHPAARLALMLGAALLALSHLGRPRRRPRRE